MNKCRNDTHVSSGLITITFLILVYKQWMVHINTVCFISTVFTVAYSDTEMLFLKDGTTQHCQTALLILDNKSQSSQIDSNPGSKVHCSNGIDTNHFQQELLSLHSRSVHSILVPSRCDVKFINPYSGCIPSPARAWWVQPFTRESI